MKRHVWFRMLCGLSFLLSNSAFCDEVTVTVHHLTTDKATLGVGDAIGTVTFEDTPGGMEIRPNLKDLTPGEHGFHIHDVPSCQGEMVEGKFQKAYAAGGHFDPLKTRKHRGPIGTGHLGDLPVLEVDAKGKTTQEMIAPRLTVAQIRGHSLMIHAGGDNYTDTPPMGGGGARVACGVIE